MKRKLSKQTIFTLLGILVIAGSIPLAVLLVKQRQEIRKEAADGGCTCDNWGDHGCGGPPSNPTYCRSDQMFQIRQCFPWGCAAMDRCVNRIECGSESNIEDAVLTWGVYLTQIDCSTVPIPTPTVTPTPTPTVTPPPTPTPTIPTGTPTPTTTVTVTPTPTTTPTPSGTPTPTPTITPTPTPTPTGTVTPTPTTVTQATPTPVVELPKAGFALPTFSAAIGGILLIVVSLLFLL